MTASGQININALGRVVATGIPWETYMERYAAQFCEWVEGTVFAMSPVSEQHDNLTRYLALLLCAYLELRPLGHIRQAPFAMNIQAEGITREPDIQIILESSLPRLTPTFMDGPADICVEVVSVESVQRDHGIKFSEYERAGVGEYWIIDPLRSEARFYRRDDTGIYVPQFPDNHSIYQTPDLPGLQIQVPLLWQAELPGPLAVTQAVQTMLAE
jgi:Uma2 family endonuclease